MVRITLFCDIKCFIKVYDFNDLYKILEFYFRLRTYWSYLLPKMSFQIARVFELKIIKVDTKLPLKHSPTTSGSKIHNLSSTQCLDKIPVGGETRHIRLQPSCWALHPVRSFYQRFTLPKFGYRTDQSTGHSLYALLYLVHYVIV